MIKLNIRKLVKVAIVGGLAVGLFLPIAIQSYVNLKSSSYQAIGLRKLSEQEQQKLYLFNQVSGEYRLLSRVINCESRWQANAYNSKSKDYGLFQINSRSWDKKAKELGYNYKTDWQDNINFGLWIYRNYGIRQWNWSKNCWK